MKRLSEEKTKILFEKLANQYVNFFLSLKKVWLNILKITFEFFFSIGANVKQLVDRPDGTYCFREQKLRVYYVSEKILKLAENISEEHLISAGTCFGKFSKTGNKFKLHVTALSYLAPYAQNKIWIKSSYEQQFLYGNHIPKSGLGRITENIPKYQGVIIYSMNDMPLGFGVTARSTVECKTADPLATICFHQADIGEYIRSEENLLQKYRTMFLFCLILNIIKLRKLFKF